MQDKRAELVEAMARAMFGEMWQAEIEATEAALDIALKAAAEIADEVETQQRAECGVENTEGAREVADRLRALMKENQDG